MSRDRNPQIFIAKLSSSIRERTLEEEFKRFGPIRKIELKRGFAFVEYEDYRDADEAIRDMDGRKFEGNRIVVEHSRIYLFALCFWIYLTNKIKFKIIKQAEKEEIEIEIEVKETIEIEDIPENQVLSLMMFALIAGKQVTGKFYFSLKASKYAQHCFDKN